MIKQITKLFKLKNILKLILKNKKFVYISKNVSFDFFIEILLFAFTIIVYIHHLSSSVYGGDSGDIAAAAVTNGVAHPSGYPLQTILGILFLKLPISATPAWKIGLISAFFSSLTVVFIYKILNHLSQSKYLSVVASLTIAFTYPFWLYAEVVEVFALHNFFFTLLIFLSLKFVDKPDTKLFYLIGLFTGLSLSNNQIILIILPFVLIFIIIIGRHKIFHPKVLIKGITLLLLGLSPYIYIPIAAKNTPFMNWGYVVNFENFWYLVTRQYYGWGSNVLKGGKHPFLEDISKDFSTYIGYFKAYIHPLIPIFAILGVVGTLFRKNFKQISFLILLYLFTGPVFLAYSKTIYLSFLGIATLERFLISNIIIMLFFVPLGILFITDRINALPIRPSLTIFLRKTTLLIVSLLPIITFIINYKRTNLNHVYIGDQLAIDVLSNIPENSVLLLRNDTIAFNTIYYQHAYNFRKDVQIPGMQNGFETLLLANGLTDQEVKEHIKKNRGIISKKIFDDGIVNLLEDNNNVFIDGIYKIVDDNQNQIAISIPYGLLYKFELTNNLPHKKTEYLEMLNILTSTHNLNTFSTNKDVLYYSLILSDIQKVYSADYYRVGEYILNTYKDNTALYYLIESAEIDPFNVIKQ